MLIDKLDKCQAKKINKSMIDLWSLLKMNKKKCSNCPIFNNIEYAEHKEVCKCKYNSKKCRLVLGLEYAREQLDKKDLQK